VLGFFDTAKPGQPLTNSVPPVLPSANWTTSALRTSGFSLLNCPARTRPCERFTRRLTTAGASLGVEVIGYSFLPAGLSPAVLPKLACRTQLAWRSHSNCARRQRCRLARTTLWPDTNSRLDTNRGVSSYLHCEDFGGAKIKAVGDADDWLPLVGPVGMLVRVHSISQASRPEEERGRAGGLVGEMIDS
jgi:hypothetical protein